MLNHAYNGLETACVMAFYAACWRLMQTNRDDSWGGLALFGALIGLMVLAQIDSAFLALILGLNELRRSWSRGPATMLARAALMGGVALAISSPWWIYNTVYFGSPMPTSGTAQQDWALEWLRLKYAEWALRLVAVPWIFAGAHEGLGAISLPGPSAPRTRSTSRRSARCACWSSSPSRPSWCAPCGAASSAMRRPRPPKSFACAERSSSRPASRSP